MTLHVALDSINNVGKSLLVEKLEEYLSLKSYSVKTIEQPRINPIIIIHLNLLFYGCGLYFCILLNLILFE